MLNLTSTFSDILKKSESGNWRYIIKIEQTAGDHINMLTDGGLNVAGAAPPVMQSWTDAGETTQIARETTLQHYEDSCVKLTYTAANGWAGILQTVVTVASTNYVLTFYTRGDGTTAGRYQVYDVSNAAFLVAETNTGVPGSGWQKVVVPFATVAGGISTRIGLISHNSTDNAIAYFDDIHLQPVSNYYYYSDAKDFTITDLTDSDIVRGVLLSRDIPIIESINIRKHTASVGGFSIDLADDGLNDAWNTNPIFNRRIWIYLGTDDLDYLDDYLLLYTGVCKNWTTERGIITLDIENSSLISQKQIPALLTDSDAAAGQGGVLPDVSKGKGKPIVYGDHTYLFMEDTTATQTGAATVYDRASNLTPCRFLGLDQDGDERWLVADHQVDTFDTNQGLWAYDPALGRMVKVQSFTVEQNTSSGCIVSIDVNATFIDYWLPDGSIANEATDAGDDGTATITNPTNACNLDNSNYGRILVSDSTSGGPPSASFDIDFPEYQNSGTITANAVFALCVKASDGGAPVITINGTNITVETKQWQACGTDALSEAGAEASVSCSIVGEEPDVNTHQLDTYMIYKQISYTANNRLQIYAGVKGREFSGTWNSRKTTGNLVEHPTDVIESILRDEVGLVDDNLDMTAIDAVNTELGANWKFSGFIDERQSTKDILEELSRQCISFTFWGAEDKVKMDTFYAANTTDRTFDIDEIDGLKVGQSPLSDIVNELTHQYKMEPGKDRFHDIITREDDRAAAAGSQTKYNAEMPKDLDTDFLTDATAAGLFADHWCKDDADSFWSVKHDIIEFTVKANRGKDFWDTTFKPLMLLELLDIIELDDADFDTVTKCNGVSWSGKQFKIFWIERRKMGLKIKAFSV